MLFGGFHFNIQSMKTFYLILPILALTLLAGIVIEDPEASRHFMAISALGIIGITLWCGFD